MVLLGFAHSILTWRLPADIHPLELRSGRSQVLRLQSPFFPLEFSHIHLTSYFSSPFSCFAQEKGPKRRAPLKRRGAAFPRTASVEKPGVVALKPLQAFPDDVAGRTRAEKPLPHRRTRDRYVVKDNREGSRCWRVEVCRGVLLVVSPLSL